MEVSVRASFARLNFLFRSGTHKGFYHTDGDHILLNTGIQCVGPSAHCAEKRLCNTHDNKKCGKEAQGIASQYTMERPACSRMQITMDTINNVGARTSMRMIASPHLVFGERPLIQRFTREAVEKVSISAKEMSESGGTSLGAD